MFMLFGQMEPDANAHKYSGGEKRNGEAVAQRENRDDYSKERSYREIGACPGCTDMSQRENKENKTHSITKKTHRRSGHNSRKMRPARADCAGKHYVHYAGNET